MGDNTDYLKLAKLHLEALRSETLASPRTQHIQEATLAVQIAQVEATEDLAHEMHLNWCANDIDCYHSSRPLEEDIGQNCVHQVRLGINCNACEAMTSLDD